MRDTKNEAGLIYFSKAVYFNVDSVLMYIVMSF